MVERNSVIPLFKSHYSFGKSILTFENKGENPNRSIIDLCIDNNINEVPLVEDTLHGIKSCYKTCKENDLLLRFGWRVSCVDDLNESPEEANSHKIIIFIKNRQGWFDFIPIFNRANNQYKFRKEPRVSLSFLKEKWTKNLDLVIPFYDNFLFYNLTQDYNFVLNFDFCDPKFCIENNKHIYDDFLSENIIRFCNDNNYEFFNTKSIYYNKMKDYKAWQILKLLTNRRYGRVSSIDVPNMDMCCSPYFCFESYLKCVNN